MAYLTIEFTGRISANDDQIRDAVERANDIFRAAGKTADEAYNENTASIDANGETSELWSKADFEATKDMGEGAALAYL